MKRFQYSLLWLLGLMAFVAIGCNALVNASAFWAGLLFTVTIFVLMVAVLGSIYRHGSARAFWLGFAIFGWAYLWLVCGPTPGRTFSEDGWQFEPQEPLATTKLLSFFFHNLLPQVRGRTVVPQTSPGGGTGMFMGTPGAMKVPIALARDFFCVGHSLWALLFAYVGGWVARYFHATRDRGP